MQQHRCGIIPLVRCFSMFGSPIKPTPQWIQLYPATFYQAASKHIPKKFTSGFADLPGQAMTKSKEPFGFLQMSIELLDLKHSNALPLYFAIENRCTNLDSSSSGASCSGSSAEQDDSHYQLSALPPSSESTSMESASAAVVDPLSVAVFNRDLLRLRRLIAVPPLISPFLSFPEVFVFIGMAWFLIYSVQTYQLPVLLIFLVWLNGFLASKSRNFAHVIVWNDPSYSLESAHNRSSASSPTFSWNNVAKSLSTTVRFLEVVQNLLSFADARMSLLMYAVLLAVAVMSSFFMAFFSPRLFLFLSIALLLLTAVVYEVVVEFAQHKMKHPVHPKLTALLTSTHTGVLRLSSFFAKVPDELELTHRHICQLSVVREIGAEMMDAAADFKGKKGL